MNIYESIATRTNGNIYVGVVGPVRTGKSTFITKFMEQMVIPQMKAGMELKRTLDELPQSGAGKQIMTMEPRFVPSEPASINFSKTKANIRLVDCVGYLVDGVLGHLDEKGSPRLVKTPWAEDFLPFDRASEIGTSKVITDHSTVGVLVTTDGTITDIDRSNYISAEERTVSELKALGKPFVVILNTIYPEKEETKKLARAMEDKYKVTVLIKNIEKMTKLDFGECFEKLLYEFPVQKISFNLPEWMRGLDENDDIISNLLYEINKVEIDKIIDSKEYSKLFSGENGILNPELEQIDLGVGEVIYNIPVSSGLFYRTLSNFTGTEILSDRDLMWYTKEAAIAKQEYDKLKTALNRALETGYGVVVPTAEEMELSEPEIVKRGTTSALKLKAKAPSLHIMKVDVETEVSPAVGGVFSAEVDDEGRMIAEKSEVWNTSMFGRTMTDIALEGILTKINTFPEEAEVKLRKTITKITNEGKGGIICILL